MAEQSQQRFFYSEVKEYFQNRDDLLPFMNELLNEKILTFLREHAVIVNAPQAGTPMVDDPAAKS